METSPKIGSYNVLMWKIWLNYVIVTFFHWKWMISSFVSINFHTFTPNGVYSSCFSYTELSYYDHFLTSLLVWKCLMIGISSKYFKQVDMKNSKNKWFNKIYFNSPIKWVMKNQESFSSISIWLTDIQPYHQLWSKHLIPKFRWVFIILVNIVGCNWVLVWHTS